MKNHLKAHAKKLGYPKELLDPIEQDGRSLNLLSEGALFGKAWERSQIQTRFQILCEHYKLDHNAPFIMLFDLAMDWVPGLAVAARTRRGRKKLNDTVKLVGMAEEIDAFLSENRGLSKKAACREYLERRELDPRWKGKSVRTLENLYDKGKAALEIQKVLFDAFRAGRAESDQKKFPSELFSHGRPSPVSPPSKARK